MKQQPDEDAVEIARRLSQDLTECRALIFDAADSRMFTLEGQPIEPVFAALIMVVRDLAERLDMLDGGFGENGFPRCQNCGCLASRHETDDEELRACRDCECEQYYYDGLGADDET